MTRMAAPSLCMSLAVHCKIPRGRPNKIIHNGKSGTSGTIEGRVSGPNCGSGDTIRAKHEVKQLGKRSKADPVTIGLTCPVSLLCISRVTVLTACSMR